MAESTTAVYKFIKPDIGGSKETWGNRLNKDLDDLDTQLALQNSSQWTGLQNGLNTTVVKDYSTTPPGTLPLTDPRFRTAGNVLYYTKAMIDTIGGNPNATPPVVASDEFFKPAERGILVPQALLYRMADLLIPVGTIVIWSGYVVGDATHPGIPAGWHLCDGTQNLQIEGGGGADIDIPDLRGRFILGAYQEDATASVHPKMKPNDPISGSAGVFGHNHANVVQGTALIAGQIPALQVRAAPSPNLGSASIVIRTAARSDSDYDLPTRGATGDATTGFGATWSGNPLGSGPANEHTHPISNVANTTPDSPWYALCYIIKIRKWETFY